MMKYQDHIIIVLMVVITIWLLYKEWKRVPVRWRIIRVICTLVAAVMLACIGLEPEYKTSGKQPHSIILLSGDADSKTAQRFKAAAPVYTSDALHAGTLPNADTIHLFGSGLTEDELKTLEPSMIVFHPDTTRAGITNVHWSNRLNKGNRLLIEGNSSNTTGHAIKMKLYGYGKVLDTAIIYPGHHHFRLETTPLHQHELLFRLLLLDGKDTLENNPVPVVVTTPPPLKVLLLAASPDFEYRFLKDWLSRQGHAIAERTMISKNKFSNDFINMKPVATGSVTTQLLNEFDLLIADAEMLDALKPDEIAAVYRQVTETGLGLLTKADTAVAPERFYMAPFRLTASVSKTQRTGLRIIGSDSLLYALEQDPLFIQSSAALRPLVTDTTGRCLAAVAMAGKGYIALTSFRNTSQWMLSGNSNAYNIYWATLFQSVINHTDHTAPVIETPMPRVNEPVMVRIQSTVMPQVQLGGMQLAPAQDAFLPYNWTATWWPVKSGWTDSLYVYDQKDWPVVKMETLKNQTIAYVRKTKTTVDRDAVTTPVSRPVPKIWFVFFFLLSMTVLWWERKTAGA